jgi:hypothetical protein
MEEWKDISRSDWTAFRWPKVGAKIGHDRRTGILDEIQGMVLKEEKDEEEELSSKRYDITVHLDCAW